MISCMDSSFDSQVEYGGAKKRYLAALIFSKTQNTTLNNSNSTSTGPMKNRDAGVLTAGKKNNSLIIQRTLPPCLCFVNSAFPYRGRHAP